MAITAKDLLLLEQQYNKVSVQMVDCQEEVSWLREISKAIAKGNEELKKETSVLQKQYNDNVVELEKQRQDFLVKMEYEKKQFEERKNKQISEIDAKNNILLNTIALNEKTIKNLDCLNDEKHKLLLLKTQLDERDLSLEKKNKYLIDKDNILREKDSELKKITESNLSKYSELNELERQLNTKNSEFDKKEVELYNKSLKISQIQEETDIINKNAKEFENLLKKREETIKSFELWNKRFNDILIEKDKYLNIREIKIIQDENNISSREKTLEEWNIDLKKARLEVYIMAKSAWVENQLKSLWINIEDNV